jgi:hypothetical protein
MSASLRNTGKNIHKNRIDYNDPDILDEIEGLARDGYDDKQIAQIFNVSANTFSRNKVKKNAKTQENLKGESGLSIALKKGRRPLTVQVENSLYKRAMGMVVTKHTKRFKYLLMPDGTQSETKLVTTTTEEIELPPDTAAIIFYLRNHRPDIYNVYSKEYSSKLEKERLVDDLPLINRIEHITCVEK